MSRIVSLSEAASIGIHSMVLIARTNQKMNVTRIAEETSSSRHHVAKVLQRLVKEGFLRSNRGPSGGFTMKMEPGEITLLEIYEAIEGRIEIPDCTMSSPVCPFEKCIMNNVVAKLGEEFRDYLNGQTVADLLK
ncbi:MAG: Rrf2 family transcriptional regulator [Bacteroidales bacterium]|nr:Rrf2 family transcriptional regulator [Bacteroidales bacterium]